MVLLVKIMCKATLINIEPGQVVKSKICFCLGWLKRHLKCSISLQLTRLSKLNENVCL